MATVQGSLDRSLADTVGEVRRAAAQQGYAILDGESTTTQLVFRRGVSALPWGTHLTVSIEAQGYDPTLITVTTRESWPLTDWGRSKRAAHKLLDAVATDS